MKTNLLIITILCAGAALGQTPGQPDSTFGGDGFAKSAYGGDDGHTTYSGFLDHQGRPVSVGGTMVSNDWYIGMTRFTTTGAVDVTFKNNGKAALSFHPDGNVLYDAFLSEDGTLWGTGVIAGPNGTDVLVVKMNSDGEIDLNFGQSGIISHEVYTGYEVPVKILEDQNGKVVILGNVPFGLSSMFVLRLNQDGTRDSSFSTDGLMLLDPQNLNSQPVDLIDRPEGGYYLLSNLSGNGEVHVQVTSISNNGNLNIDLGGPGETTFQIETYDTRGSAIALMNGSLIIAGYFTGANVNNDGFVARLERDGNLNMNFNQKGYNLILKSLVNTGDETPFGMVVTQDSAIFIGTTFREDSNMLILSRFQPDGNVYGNFGGSGHYHSWMPEGGYPDIEFVTLLLDASARRAYVLGYPADGSNDFVFAYAAYTGDLDTTTGGGTGLNTPSRESFRAYPNPSNGTLQFDREVTGPLFLYNTAGKLMAVLNAEDGTVQLPAELQNGAYLLRVSGAEGIFTAKIILQR